MNRKEMISYLSNHFRYFTANSWNKLTSYAVNLKIHELPIDLGLQNKLYDLINCENFYDEINNYIQDFDRENQWQWQAA